MKRGKHLDTELYKSFQDFSKDVFDNFIQKYFKFFRDEIVHINNFGSAMGSIAFVDDGGKVTLRAFQYTDETELLTVFQIVMRKMSEIIETISKIIMTNDCLRWGWPTRDATFNCGITEVKISDFYIHRK